VKYAQLQVNKTGCCFNMLFSNISLYILEAAKFVKKQLEKFKKNSEHPDANIRITRILTYNENMTCSHSET
jgi:hypothetical protein